MKISCFQFLIIKNRKQFSRWQTYFPFFCFQEQKTILENNCQTRLKSFFTSWISSTLELLPLLIDLLAVVLICTEGKSPGPDPPNIHPFSVTHTATVPQLPHFMLFSYAIQTHSTFRIAFFRCSCLLSRPLYSTTLDQLYNRK